ncbi:MAG: polyphosphate kinase 1 [Pseudomonadota bacterium]|nr:polyphosphate kinase 1 [Pseudomonadota bacterium]
MGGVDLSSPELYINRELSLLEFNRRVLEQAKDESVPLLERLTFLCISASNLDEFFEIRVAGLVQQAAFGASKRAADGMTSSEQLRRIAVTAHALVDEQYRVLNEVLIPRLQAENIRFLRRAELKQRQLQWVKRYFSRELAPVLSPIALDPSHPFPRVLNKSLNFIVTLEGKDAFGRDSGMAIVGAPRSLPRLVQLPESVAGGPYDFVFLSSLIHQHVGDLFPGMKVSGCYQFRVTRNSDLFVDEEEIDDLKRALEGELSARRFGDEVRLEVADDCPEDLVEFLIRQFELEEANVYRCNGPVNLTRLMAIPGVIERPDLKYAGFVPAIPQRVRRNDDFFDVVRRGDLLVHHPFESFAPVVDFLRAAARDPKVLAIRQTLYRTGAGSAVVKALMDAAREGKEVTVVIELRARFDEEENIELAEVLQEAGAHVVYGIVGHKTHAKMVLVVRREGRALKRYVHLGTGNYHPKTARLYTDYGLFTCDATIGEDVQKMFQQLTAMGRVPKLKKLVQSPFALHKRMLELVAAEAERARAGKPARIIAKMNSLVEPQIIRALYEASQAGVKVDLIIRGICCARPGVKGVSENMQVRSIVGRFLEHTRVFCFENGDDDPLVYCSSADWMDRNFFSRVESCFPVEDKRIRQRILDDMQAYLSDNTQAWVLRSDGSYKRVASGSARRKASQDILLESMVKR